MCIPGTSYDLCADDPSVDDKYADDLSVDDKSVDELSVDDLSNVWTVVRLS